MIHFGEPHINSNQKDYQDSFGFGKSAIKRGQSMYEKCAFQCVNGVLGMTQQEVNCIQLCYNKEFNNAGFKDAKLYLWDEMALIRFFYCWFFCTLFLLRIGFQ